MWYNFLYQQVCTYRRSVGTTLIQPSNVPLIHPGPAVMGEFQQELFFVAAVDHMPETSWNVMPIGPCHSFSPCCLVKLRLIAASVLYRPFDPQKSTYRDELRGYFRTFIFKISRLTWSDPSILPQGRAAALMGHCHCQFYLWRIACRHFQLFSTCHHYRIFSWLAIAVFRQPDGADGGPCSL